MFPDLNAFEKWSIKAKELSHLASFTVSNLLERNATDTEKKQGLDLADHLIRFDYRKFSTPQPKAITTTIEPPPAAQPKVEVQKSEPTEPAYKNTALDTIKIENWEQEITKLEKHLTGIALPTQPINLNRCSTITNYSKFIESHFATVKANNGKPSFIPYLHRLKELSNILQSNRT